MDAVLQSLAARGYRWYLGLKIGKALLAIPCFVCWVALMTVGCLLLGAWEVFRAVVWDFPRSMTNEMDSFWRKPWFRGFSRVYYQSLTHYKPAPTPLPAEDRTTPPHPYQEGESE